MADTSTMDKRPGPPVPMPYGKVEPKRVLRRNKREVERMIMNGEVSAVYPHAIEVPGFLFGTAKGMLTFAGLSALAASMFGWFMGFLALSAGKDTAWFAALFSSFGLIALGIATTFLRMDLFGYRDEPVLFNRKTRKVHLFRRRANMLKPWAAWPLVIDTYDWDCILGEVHGGFQMAGGSLPAMRYRLLAAAYDGPTGRGRKVKLIDRFVIGAEMPSQTYCIARWEHIRRYMEEGGPALQAGEPLLKRTFSHRDALARGGLWALETGFYDGFKDKPGPKIAGTLLTVLLSPVFVFFGAFRWLAEITSKEPWWPEGILEAAGGAPLPDGEVYARAAEVESTVQEIAPEAEGG